MILDLRQRKFSVTQVKDAKTVVWNGPMAVLRDAELRTWNRVAVLCANSLADTDAVTIIGGGDSAKTE